MLSKASTLSMMMQHTWLSRWKPMMASLSFGFMSAFSRRSLGRTICPFASTETIASILQHSLLLQNYILLAY